MADKRKKNVISNLARNLSLTENDVRHLSLDLFGKTYDAITDEDANEMISYLRIQEGQDYLEFYE